MLQEIKPICLALPYKMGTVNCYLIKTDSGYLLIDTGGSNKRIELETELANAGCKPGQLNLIVITHGDFDHTGNAAYLRQAFNTKIAMHRDDAGMAERGDMLSNRKKPNILGKMMFALIPLLFGFGKSSRFTPDVFLQDGDDLSKHGFNAQVLSLPGHSQGSIGILTAGGDLFCGDLLDNTASPALSSMMDDPAAGNASIDKLSGWKINTAYPGHGQPFPMEAFLKSKE